MHDFELRELRRAVLDGDPLDLTAVQRALDALADLRQRVGTPTELHLSALVDVDQPDRWRVAHPLLRTEASADNAADALVIAASDLRPHFTTGPDGNRRDPNGWRHRRIARAEWEALAGRGTREADALRSALAHIDHLETELAEERDRAFDRRVTRGGGSRVEQEQTRARLRARSLERLAACNVEGVERSWGSDSFGSLDEFGVPGPVLVLAAHASTERSTHVDHRFDAARRWLALDHRCSDGVGADSLPIVATPLPTDMATHHRLARLTQIMASRAETIEHLCDYRAAVAELFDGAVTVDRQRGPVGGGCWPLDLASLPTLTGVQVEEIEQWAEPDTSAWFRLGPSWQLLLLGPSVER